MKENVMSELTAEMIVDQNFPRDVQIAPDGRQVAYIMAFEQNR
jgi:hypothetical protein